MSAPRWVLSVRDWRAHAVDDEHAERHPPTAWVARCGLVMPRMAVDEPPTRICFACANPAEGTP